MHGEPLSSNSMAIVDDSDMDNENENNISGGGGAGNLLGAVLSSHQQAAAAGGNNNNSNPLTLHSAYNADFEVNNPSIDLDMYVSGYTGLMRINRLIFLAEHCPLLRIDALRLALNYIMETYNTQLYMTVHKQLTDAFSRLNAQQQEQQAFSLPSYDSSWVETTNKKASLKLEKLDQDLSRPSRSPSRTASGAAKRTSPTTFSTWAT